METKFAGHYIVLDPKICHGKPTFRGTRILVADVLEQVSQGTDWETIIKEWRGSISQDAIAEAVSLYGTAHIDQDLNLAYAQMAQDVEQAAEALTWSEALIGDLEDETE